MRWLDVLTGALIVLTTILICGGAKAHSFYESKCCNDKDCAPVDDGAVVEGPEGYRLPNGDVIQYGDGRLRFSPDNHFHWCHGQQSTYCLYIPGRGI